MNTYVCTYPIYVNDNILYSGADDTRIHIVRLKH